jgi:UPF0716 protein FxsA
MPSPRPRSRLRRSKCYPDQTVLGRLFLLFTVVPLIELFLLVQLGAWMGVWPTIALVAATGFVGAALARREGRRALASYQEAMARGRMPEEGIVSGLLILAGGVMLITPGVLTDVFGLAMMVPPVRRAAAKLVGARLQKRVSEGSIRVMHLGVGGFGAPSWTSADEPVVGDWVDAEVVESREDQPGDAGPGKEPAKPAGRLRHGS